ncbi:MULTISPECIES: IS481 family transposase [Microbacterium]|uniref:IS481 family transposase n=1 Tax=Microbacterium TaxID=33882 RepID=UPI0005ABCE56|nr:MULTISPECIES: IS481 family transposase [Microbacterium]KIP89898.1 transposase [Microbacterium sp. MEJ108Y]MBS1674476.1 IS481 family transposase [Actinomycetota bacterium]WKT90519.1 IS481 family transposase [Microbacterium liquefaciens]
MSHANAALTPRQRLRLAQKIVDEEWTVAAAADYFRVSWPTAAKWARRYVELGEAGMADRSSRPHAHPNKTPTHRVKKIVHLRIRKRLGPVQIADRVGMPASTVHAVLKRCRLNRLSHVDVKTGEPARRYEHDKPGALIHVDVKKLGNIPDGGGWRYVGRSQGDRNRAVTAKRTGKRGIAGDMVTGTAYVHTVIDDHSRVAYAEIHDDERAETAIGVLQRAVSWFADRGVRVERVLSDNGPAYRSHAWRRVCAELAITPKRTRPYRPQTNGKIERFHRTMADGWAYVKHYNSESARRAALPAWLHFYNHHGPHTAIGKLPPISRISNNLPGQYT